MEIAGLTLYLAALTITVITPGQGVAALLNIVLSNGRKAALSFNIGLTIGDIFWLGLAIFGLGLVEWIIPYLRYGGVVYLLYFAFSMWKTAAEFGEAKEIKVTSFILYGLLLTLSNPKVMLFYLALTPSFLNVGAVTFPQFLWVSLWSMVVIFGINVLYILLSEKLFALIKDKPTLIKIRRANALILALLAFIILFQGF
jgi:threonine/homoserine/homoserine lactone efflux protein